MPNQEYNIVISLVTDEPTHILEQRISEFISQYEDAIVLSIEPYNADADFEPPWPDDRQYPANYMDNYPGHPI